MTLTIQDLGALGELLGAVAVLATLVYLALQMRQNTLAIAATRDAARISATLQLGLTGTTSNELGLDRAEVVPCARTSTEIPIQEREP